MSKEIEKKSSLGGKMEVQPVKDGGKAKFKGRKYDPEGDMKKHGLVPVSKVVVENPITKEKKEITIKRDGTSDMVLLEALADPSLSRERKDQVLSMYLFERGKESASFLMDLWASKGQHTKQTNVFKTQVRRDVDIMVETFAMFMRDSSDRILHGLQYEVRTVKEGGKEKKILHRLSKNVQAIDIDLILGTLADVGMYFSQTADLIEVRMQEETERREKEKGRGIYVDVKGGVYNIYQDADIVKRVRDDMKSVQEEQQHGE